MPLTDREKLILCQIGSDLYGIAKPTRFDLDATFVKVRRSALEAFADKLKAVRQENMNASSLLSITQPEHLFPGDEGEAKSLYRELSKRWHPDVPSGDESVVAWQNRVFVR